jgi:hypothetical protein
VPALVIHRTDDQDVKIDEGRYIADRIPGAHFVELQGDAHIPWVGDQDSVLDEVQEFLTGNRPTRDVDRVLATVLFTDIVRSTDHLARVGDRAWIDLRDRHHALVRRELATFRGREVNTAGDGSLRRLMDRLVRCAVRCAFSRWRETLAFSYAPECTPAKSSSRVATSAGLPFISGREFVPWRTASRRS